MICDCGHDSVSYSVRFSPAGTRTICRNCTRPRLRESSANPFAALRLDHVHDEFGSPVEVTSLRQLQMAEKRYKFRSLVANERSTDFDKPPQHRPQSLAEQMSQPFTDQEGTHHESHWLYPETAQQVMRDLEENGDSIS